MKGYQVLMQSFVGHGVSCIFGNPGTTENPLLEGLIDTPEITYYTALHEGVAVTAASFYAQASGKTGVVNLHVAPGLGNGLGSLYGALKANSPLLITAGQQDTRMRLRTPLLSHDLVSMAAPLTKWSAEAQHADEIAPLLRRAFKIAHEAPMGPVFLALPVDVMSQETETVASYAGDLRTTLRPDPDGISALAQMILASERPMILTGDDVARDGAFETLVTLAEQIGASVRDEGLRAQLSFPNQHPNYQGRLAFDASGLHKQLSPYDLAILIGLPCFEDIWFDPIDAFPETTKVAQIVSTPEQLAANFPVHLGLAGSLRVTLSDLIVALEATAPSNYQAAASERNNTLRLAREEANQRRRANASDDSPLSSGQALRILSQGLPENVIVVDESITAVRAMDAFDYRSPGDYYSGRGGGIGQGLAGAIGVSVAHADRRIVAVSGDGSAMYSVQALWTAAHYALPILFVILANRQYRVLKLNMDTYRRRFGVSIDRPYPHMDLAAPDLHFTDMARGMGVPAISVDSAETLRDGLQDALKTSGPFVVEISVE